MGTVPPCHGVARRGSFIWVMIPVPSMGSVCEVCVRGATVTLHDAPVDILFRCLEVLCHLLFPLCHRNVRLPRYARNRRPWRAHRRFADQRA